MLAVTNVPLYFTDTTQGETALVFLHYFGGSERTWQPVTELLKANCRCIAIDLWGFGSSPEPQQEISVADSAAKVLDVLQILQLKDFVLLGHSMGGKIALAVAATMPAGLQQLILVAPSPPVPEPMTDDKRKELLATWGQPDKLKKLIENITAHPLKDDVFETALEDHLRISQTGWDSWLNKGSGEDITAYIHFIQQPIHVVHGSSDPNFTMEFLQKIFNRYFKDVRFIELPDVGHVVPLEAPEKLAKIIRQAVSECTNPD